MPGVLTIDRVIHYYGLAHSAELPLEDQGARTHPESLGPAAYGPRTWREGGERISRGNQRLLRSMPSLRLRCYPPARVRTGNGDKVRDQVRHESPCLNADYPKRSLCSDRRYLRPYPVIRGEGPRSKRMLSASRRKPHASGVWSPSLQRRGKPAAFALFVLFTVGERGSHAECQYVVNIRQDVGCAAFQELVWASLITRTELLSLGKRSRSNGGFLSPG
jgi:hypothetical protein